MELTFSAFLFSMCQPPQHLHKISPNNHQGKTNQRVIKETAKKMSRHACCHRIYAAVLMYLAKGRERSTMNKKIGQNYLVFI